MQRVTLVRSLLGAGLATALALAGCTSDDGIQEIEPSDAAEPEPDPDPEPGPDPEPEPAPEPEPEPEPEPDQEPDPDEDLSWVDGIVIPASALEINDEIDVEPEIQREVLEVVMDAYLVASEAFDTLEYDEQVIESYYSGDIVEETYGLVEQSRQEGFRQITEADVRFVRAEQFHLGDIEFTVIYCSDRRGDSGVVDTDSGEYLTERAPGAALYTATAKMVGMGDDAGWRVTRVVRGGEHERCE